MNLPWAFILTAAGIVLIAGDGWFPGQTLVGILAVASGVLRGLFAFGLKALVVAILSAAADQPKVPPRTRRPR